jgi:hypothetical protein
VKYSRMLRQRWHARSNRILVLLQQTVGSACPSRTISCKQQTCVYAEEVAEQDMAAAMAAMDAAAADLVATDVTAMDVAAMDGATAD